MDFAKIMQLMPGRNCQNITKLALTQTEKPSVSKFYDKALCLIEAGTTRKTLHFQSYRNNLPSRRTSSNFHFVVSEVM